MRYLLILFLILAFVVGCGCSNNPMVPPAYGYFGDDKDVWPALYGTANGAVDNGIFITYDQGDAAWDAPNVVDTDLLPLQWTPQRNSVGWNTAGTWNASFIEATGNDLEIWDSPDADWQDEAGAWGLLDADATVNWLAVDVETRQNYVWAVAAFAGNLDSCYIDLTAIVPTWTFDIPVQPTDDIFYSMVLDNNLSGGLHVVHIHNASVGYYYNYFQIILTEVVLDITGGVGYPQIIVDGEERLWCFYTLADELVLRTSFDQPSDTNWGAAGLIYTAVILTDDYHASWCAYDDTIHVVLVDEDSVNPNATHLVYMRRTANGWVEQEILLTVDSTILGDDDHLAWPQITVDKLGNIFVYYIFLDTFIAAGGDLQGWYLDSSVYGNPIAASWVQHVNIDQSADLVKWVVAPDSIPISADM